jgi:hypothetical protein
MATVQIGTGETDTTINGWESRVDGVLTEIEEGQAKAEAFDEDVSISGSTTTSSFYMHLTSVDGAEHDGRSNEVSSAGNARIEGSVNVGKITIIDEWFRFSWMEIHANSAAGDEMLWITGIAASDSLVHHNIIHNDNNSSNTGQIGMLLSDADVTFICYRNIVYGMGASGIDIENAAAGTEVFNNTCFDNNNSNAAGRAGILCDSANATVTNNICVDNSQADFDENAGTFDYNADADSSGSGANTLNGITTTDNLTNPTSTFSNTDLTIKGSGGSVPVWNAGNNPGVGGGVPEAQVPISDRSGPTSQWSIGADDVDAADDIVILRRRRSA